MEHTRADQQEIRDMIAELKVSFEEEIAKLREDMEPIFTAYNRGSFTFMAISWLAKVIMTFGSVGVVFYSVYSFFHK
jgi:hypothetical protein